MEGATAPAPPRPGTKAAIQLQLDNALHDLVAIRDALLSEAQRRGWCSDYEWFVRHTNPTLRSAWLLGRSTPNGLCAICGELHPV